MAGVVREISPGREGVQEQYQLDGKGAVPTYNFQTDPEGAAGSSANGGDDDAKSDHFQDGVQRVRAITDTWSRKTMIVMFLLLYLVTFVDGIFLSVQGALNIYVTSTFSRHGLIPTINVVATIISGCSNLTLAKFIDIFGRIEGFGLMLVVSVISMIMKAVVSNVEMYFAAHTLYWVSHVGLIYVIDVMVADMTSLKNRMIIFGINNTPMIASTFGGPAIAQLFYDNLNFRWAFGAFTIILVGVAFPVAAVMIWMQIVAKRAGRIHSQRSGRKWHQSVWHYLIQFDVVGIILITAGFALFLLPFSIATYAPNGWATPYIIVMLILGIGSLGLFFLWEYKYSPAQFLPWHYLKDRSIVGSCLLYAIMFLSSSCWLNYFGTYLQVVNRLSITTAGYVQGCYGLGAAVVNPFVGGIISYTGNFKWAAYVGAPIMIIGTGLMIPFRQPDTHVGLLVLTQLLVGIGSAFFTTCAQIAAMSPVTHQEIAAVLAVWTMFGSVGSSIGSAISGGIWNNVLPEVLLRNLPEQSKDQAPAIFGSLVVAMSYEDGTPERDAILATYGLVQRYILIAGVVTMPLTFLSIYMWRNINVKKLEEENDTQTKGTVL
ncbi:hypothetical protein Q7P37_006113 [Cladosporium fusiforme]